MSFELTAKESLVEYGLTKFKYNRSIKRFAKSLDVELHPYHRKDSIYFYLTRNGYRIKTYEIKYSQFKLYVEFHGKKGMEQVDQPIDEFLIELKDDLNLIHRYVSWG